MPLYIAHLPDYPNSLERRLSVRQGHLERATKDKEQGTSIFGRAFISPDHASTTSNPNPSIDPSQPHPGMAGSIMIFRFDTIDQVWARIKDDLYWTAGVWDKENARVDQLLGAPGDEKVGEIKP
jgi:uncharacterized protein YciI